MIPKAHCENSPRSPLRSARGTRRALSFPLSSRAISTERKAQRSAAAPITFPPGRMSANQHKDDPQSGKTLVLALVILGMATLLIGSFMLYVSTSQRVTRVAGEQITSHYSADAGIERTIWRLVNNDFGFADAVAAASGSAVPDTFELNGQTVVVSVIGTTSCGEKLVNGGFENGIPPDPWVEISPHELISYGAAQAHSENYYAMLGGVSGKLEEELYQPNTITLPANVSSATLTYWRYITTTSEKKNRATLTATIRDSSGTPILEVEAIHNQSANDAWEQVPYVWNDASDYAGQTIQVHFRSELKRDKTNYTSFYLDDVSLLVCEPTVYLIESRAGDKVIQARVRFENDNPVILSWEIDP